MKGNSKKNSPTKDSHVFERIVVVERGSCTEQVSQLARPNQLVVVQAPGETLPQFVLRASLQNGASSRAKTALVLLGEDTALAPRRTLLDVLAKQLVPGQKAQIQLVSGDAADRKWVAWQLLEEAHSNKALRAVNLGFKVGETNHATAQQSA